MQRWVWGFDGKKFAEARPIHVKLGERVRFILINDTIMEHPIHVHGFLFALENGRGNDLPLKHTVNVNPGERMSLVFTADTPATGLPPSSGIPYGSGNVPHRHRVTSAGWSPIGIGAILLIGGGGGVASNAPAGFQCSRTFRQSYGG